MDERVPVEPDWIVRAADEFGYAWARVAWQRASRVPGAWFDTTKADGVVALWPKVFTHTQDRFAGKPFRLTFWEEIVVRLLVGWKTPIEVVDDETGEASVVHARLFRQLRLWIPRKNGKSEFLAALALLFWALEGLVRGQGFVFARDEAQARAVFDPMCDMVANSDELRKNVTTFKKSLWIQRIKAAFSLLAGKPEGKHGRGPQVIVGDEMHEWASRDLANTLRQGTGTRLQPIELYASTAGPKSAEVGHELWEESLAIYEGRIDDPTTLVVIFAAGPEDEWTDEEVWKKANPSLGLSPTVAFLRRELAFARGNPRAEAQFRCFHLNQWIDAIVRWLNLEAWDACAPDREGWKKFAEELTGRECLVSFDCSSTQDVTALIALFPPVEPGERIKLLCEFWVPEDTLAERVKRDRVSYDVWAKMGALTPTPGNCVDQDFVKQRLLEWLGRYKVLRIGRDPWNSIKLVTDLQKDGVDPGLFVDLRQGHQTLGEPSKEFERLIYAGQLDHGGHPVLRWMAGNAQCRFDENLNYVPAKKRSRDKIDGIVATVMDVALLLASPATEARSEGVVMVIG